MWPQAKDAWSFQKLEEAGRTFLYSLQRQHSPAAPGLRTLASRTVGEYISVALSHQVCGNWLQQPQDTQMAPLVLNPRDASQPSSLGPLDAGPPPAHKVPLHKLGKALQKAFT